MAEKVRASIEDVGLSMSYPAGFVTASIGVAEYRAPSSTQGTAQGASGSDKQEEDVLVAADRALYRAKALGRNRVATADGGGDTTT